MITAIGILILFVIIFSLFFAIYVKQLGYDKEINKNLNLLKENENLIKDLNQTREMLTSKFEETLQLATTDQLIQQVMMRKKAIILVIPEMNDFLFSNLPVDVLSGDLVKIHFNIPKMQFKSLITNMASSINDDEMP